MWRYYIPSRRKAGTSRNIIFDEHARSSVTHHNIEGELAATKISTYRDLLVPDPASKFNVDDDDFIPPSTTPSQLIKPPSSVHDPAPPSTSSSPSQLASSSLNHTLAPPVPTLPSPSISPPVPPPKPKQRTRGPAKIYHKSRSSQRIEARQIPPKANKTAEGSDEPVSSDADSDDKDEAQVRDELEPEFSELTNTPAFLATGNDSDSYEEAIGSVDRDEWLAAMQAEMDSILSVGTFELVPPPHDHKPIGCKWVFHIK